MEREYLAKYISRKNYIKIDFYKENGFIYMHIYEDEDFEMRAIVNIVPSRLPGFEEVGLNG